LLLAVAVEDLVRVLAVAVAVFVQMFLALPLVAILLQNLF
jgi:hypothetical protein